MWFFNRNQELAYLALEVAKMKRQVKILTERFKKKSTSKKPKKLTKKV
jgi:uncharacterized coiled-coil protein SlyX